MSKPKKWAVVAVLAMVLAFLPAQLFAANADADSLRLAGDNRQETAIQISYAGWEKADSVILAPSNQANLVDALAAAPLAGQLNAPILLTPVDKLDPLVKARIAALGAKKVYVVGAIADSVTAEVEAMTNVAAIALKGSGRCETAAKVNALLDSPQGSFVVGHSALADALSVASYAAKHRYAIIVTDSKGLIPEGQEVLGEKTYLIGGPALVSNEIAGTRIYGQDRFETNLEVPKALKFNYDRVYVANGHQNHLVDSLAVAPLAARYGAFIALADDKSMTVKAAEFVNTKVTNSAMVIAVGGEAAVSDELKARIGITKLVAKSLSKAPRGIAPNQVEFTVNWPIGSYDLSKITLSGHLVTKDSAGNTQVHPQSVALLNYPKNNEGIVTLTLYGNVADTSFAPAGGISLAEGAFTTLFGTKSAAQEDFITSFEDYCPPAPLMPGDARTQDEDLNGRIDGILITYSEQLNTPSVTASDYQVEGYVVKSVRVQGNTVLVRVDEIGVDSDANPKITQVGEVADDSPRHFILGPQDPLEAADGVAPFVDGIEDGKSYTVVTPTFTEGTANLRKDGGAWVKYTSGTTIEEAGSYVLKVIDAAGNTTTINFTVK
jgi:putative cell wall-binding protein